MKKDPKRANVSADSLWRRIRELEAEVARLKLSQLAEVNPSMDVLPELEALAKKKQGYFRFGAARNDQLWFRYKWTVGPLAGRYAIAGHDTLLHASWSLLASVDRFETGPDVPPMDGKPEAIRR